MAPSDSDELQEIRDRARRIETRLTRVANFLGVEAGGEKPSMNEHGELVVPSRKVSLDDILAALPEGHKGRTDVYCGEDFIVTMLV